MKTERLYALTRIDKGDYLLPSNDGKTLWRIYSYPELEGRAGTSWGYAKYIDGGPERFTRSDDDLADWGYWETYADSFPSRQAAIDDALHERATS
jgi:hypothetical protein